MQPTGRTFRVATADRELVFATSLLDRIVEGDTASVGCVARSLVFLVHNFKFFWKFKSCHNYFAGLCVILIRRFRPQRGAALRQASN